MSELDPNILKRNLPEDIHAAVDQVKDNVDSAVKGIVDGYRQYANEVADKFEKLEFDGELRSRIEEIKSNYTKELDRIEDSIQSVTAGIAKLRRDAENSSADAPLQELNRLTRDLDTQANALSDKLKAFRATANKFAEQTGGLIAKTAIRTVTGGIA